MKTIIILTDRARIAAKIGEDLRCVFQDKIKIETLTFKEAKHMDQIDGDLILFTLGNRIERVKHKIPHPEKILIVRRTIKEKDFVKIFEIPKNTEVLVVNDNYENTLQTVSLLYDLNVDNIKLKPYREDECDKAITVAITPGEPEKVPGHIKKIINIGDRCLDLSTFMNIIYRLQINDDEISKRLLSYTNQIVNSNEGLNKHYKEAVAKNIQMERVLEVSEKGVVMTLPDGEITLYNKRFVKMVGSPVKEGTRLMDLFNDKILSYLKSGAPEEKIVKINKRDIAIKKNRVVYERDIYQDLYFFDDVTYLKSLEQTISKEIKSSGFAAKYQLGDIIYHSKAMGKCIESAKIFAQTEKTILILGESGTGKELLAQSIHNLSERSLWPFVAVNCAAVPSGLLESELFGYVKGAFTGASREGKIGMFECANNGTIFLDEIGDMPYSLQSRLLRAVQERQIMRIGSDKVIDINVRIISATNKDLLREVELGNFRKDLYYRISVLPITIPPIRQRREDIMDLFRSFLSSNTEIPSGIEKILTQYSWPGNVREIRNAAEYYELMKNTPDCLPEYLLNFKAEKDVKQPSVETCILKILSGGGAGSAGMGRTKLREELKSRYQIVISEYALRTVIKNLEQEGCIVKTQGRNGTILTKKGAEELKRADEESGRSAKPC